MTPSERMSAAMSREIPDRVPVMCQMSIGHMLVQTGFRPSEFWHSAGTFAAGLLRLRSLYGFDGVLVSLHGHRAGWEAEVLGVSRDGTGEHIRWKDGRRTFYPVDDLPVPGPEPEPRPAFSTFDPDGLPDQAAHIPVSQGLRFPLDPDRLFEVFDLVGPAVRGRYSFHGEVTSPLDYYLDLFGFEQALAGLVDDGSRAEAVLARLTDGIIPLARGMVERGVEAVKISSPYAGAGFLSPSHYRRFVLPCEARIAAAVRSAGAHAYLHTCGDIHDRLDLMAGSGASGIECLDPPPLGRVDLAEAKARVGDRLFIKGNIDPVHTLLRGDPDTVRQDARRRVAVAGPGGGFILSTACSIAPRTPAENVRILAEVGEESGRGA